MRLIPIQAVIKTLQTTVLVNPEFVESVEDLTGGRCRITMTSGKEFEVEENPKKVWQDLARP